MAIPAKLPEWDTTEVNIVEVDQQHKDEGWVAPGGVPEKPPFQSFNWWQNLVYQWTKYFDESISYVTPEQFGAVGDGVTDDRINLQNAITFAVANNKDLKIDGNHYMKLNLAESALSGINNIKMYGTGSITMESNVLTESFNGLVINGDNVTIEGLTIKSISNASGTVTIFVNTGSNCNIINCDLSTSSLEPHIILLADSAVCNNWNIENNYFHDFNFGIFTNNTFGTNNNGGQAYDWRITNNLFENMQREALEFNSSDLEAIPADRPWRRIIIDSNIFKNRTSGPISTVIGFDSASDLTITNNLFENVTVEIYTSVIHIENAGGNCIISNNGFDNVYRGIEVYHDSDNFVISGNRLNGLTHYGNSTLVSSMTFTGPNNTGIEVISTDGIANNISIIGNLISNFSNGIFIPVPSNNIIVSGNNILFCEKGLWLGGEFNGIFERNFIGNCINGIELKEGHNNLGKNTFSNCNNVVLDSQTTGKTIFNGIVVEYTNTVAMPLPTITKTTTGDVPLFNTPLLMDGSMSISCFTPISNLNYTDSMPIINYDGTTLTTSLKQVRNNGSVTTNLTPISITTSVNARIFQDVAVDAEVEIRANFSGMILF